jgi:hypothetical protein
MLHLDFWCSALAFLLRHSREGGNPKALIARAAPEVVPVDSRLRGNDDGRRRVPLGMASNFQFDSFLRILAGRYSHF